MTSTLEYTPGQKRSRPMQVLALGLPRTGTHSMSVALEVLGYKHCAHAFDMFDSPSYTAAWEPALNHKYKGRGPPLTREDWDALLGHCSSVSDCPCVLFWRELHEAYPEAKIVLVERNEDKWYESFSEAIIERRYKPSAMLREKYLLPLVRPRTGIVIKTMLEGWLKADSEDGMKANARSVYRKHYEDIRATIPKEQLLEFQLKDGWRPLCNFLGKDVPDEDFPFVNDREAIRAKFQEAVEKLYKELQVMVLTRVLPTVAVLAAAALAWNMAR